MADNASEQIKTLSVDVQNLDKRLQIAISHVAEYDKEIALWFEKARVQGMANTDQLVDYLSKRFSNLQIKTAVAPLLSFDEKEIDRAARRYASLLEKQDFLEKSRSIAVGGRKFAELRGEDLKNWREFSTLLAAINEQKKQIEQSTPGAAEAGQKLYKEQLAFQKAQEVQEQESRRIAQEKADAKRKAAEDERQLNKEIAEEEKRRTAEAKQRYKEAIDANKSMIKEEEELAKLRREQRAAESKAAYNEYFKKQQNAQKQADKESLNNQRRQIQLKAEMSAIDKKRAADSKQLTAEEKARYREISSELTKLIARQKELDAISQGSGKRARGRLSKYEITEVEKAMRRYGNAIQDARNKQQGLNNETNKMLPTLQRLASAFGIAFSIRGLAQFGKKLIEVRGEFEMQFVAMKQIIGDVDAATKIWNQTLQQALQSPKTFKELVTYTKQLAAYRIETEKLFDTTKRLADVSAGLGVDMGRLILAYGQVKAANYLRASEVRQFTEAGVNIYGELAKYFSEIEGRAVGTAEVVERVTKRMVLFSDVENIFKRMTDEGGAFFNMQEVQADTVKGQIMKLRDAYDQMLNTIGEQNQGTIRDLIEAINELVRNWRDVASFIMKNVNALVILLPLMTAYRKGAALAAGETWTWSRALIQIKADLFKARMGVEKFSLSTALATTAVNLLRGAVVLAKTALKTFLPVLAFEGIAWFVTKLGHARRELKAFREELEKVSTENIDSMSREIDGYGVLLEKIKKTNEGTLARKELMDEMSSKYGKYLDFVVNEKTSVDDLSNAYDRVTQSIRDYTAEKIRGEQEQKLGTAMYDEYQNMIKALTGATITDMEGLKSYGTLTKQQAQNIAKLIRESLEKYGSADISQIIQTYLGNTYGKGKYIRGGVSKDLQAFVNNWKSLNEELKSITSEFAMPVFGTETEYREYQSRVNELRNFLQFEDAEYKKQIAAIKERTDLEQWQAKEKIDALEKEYKLRQLNKQQELGLITEEQYRHELKKIYGDLSAYEADYNKRLAVAIGERFGADWKEQNEDALKMYRAVESTESALQQGTIQRNKQLKESYDGLKDSLKQYEARLLAAKSTGASGSVIEDIEGDIKWAKQNMEAIELAAKLRGIDLSDKKSDGTDTIYSNRIRLLQRMFEAYKKAAKEAYSFAKAEEKTGQSFEDAWNSIMPAGYGDLEVPTSYKALAEMLQRLEAFTPAFDKNGQLSKMIADLKEAIADALSNVDIEMSVRIRENFAREIEKMFSDYELTLELQKLNISPDAAKNLFPNLDLKTMKDIQDRMQAFYKDQVEAGGFDEKDLETYRKYADKIDAEIMKERMARAKEYSKFLEKEYSDRAKLQMQYARDVAFVRMNFEGEQQENILRDLKNKLDKDLNQLEWKSFRESSFYVDMMDDLTSLPKEYLDMMLKKLDEIIQNSQIDPEVMKEAIKARQKVIDAQLDIRPLNVMKDSLEGIKKAMGDTGVGGTFRQTYKNIQKEIKDKEELIQKNEKEAQTYRDIAVALKLVEDANDAVTEAKGKLGYEALESFIQGENNLQDELKKNAKRIAEIKAKENEATKEEKDELATLQARNIFLSQEIDLLEQATKKQKDQTQALTDYENVIGELKNKGFDISQFSTSTEAENAAQEKDEENKQNETRLAKLREWLKQFKTFFEGWTKFNAAINNTINSVAQAGNAFYDMFQALGGETDAVTDAWKEFGNTMVSTITNTLTMIPMMVAAFKAAGIAITSALGIIGIAAQALTVIFTTITGFAKLHDAGYEKTIQRLQNKIDDLANAYKRLEKAIDKTLTGSDYLSDYNQQVQNIHDRIDAINAQINAERSKKNSSAEKIRQYQNEIIELEEELENIEQKKIEVFGGLGEINYRSAAEEFVDAWKEAFLETGDGLQGLQDHFDEFLNEWFVKQATMRIAGRMLEPLFEDIDKAVDESSQGGADVLLSELQRVREKFATIAPQLSDSLEQLAGMWGLGDTEGGLSGLAAGIQGMTEEQANILEAYWNSVRMYTASIDMNVSRIVEILGAGVGDRVNPQLQQLELIARNTSAIQSLFGSVVEGGHTRGGRGVRVFVD